jgi:hypothetical protein
VVGARVEAMLEVRNMVAALDTRLATVLAGVVTAAAAKVVLAERIPSVTACPTAEAA